MLHQLVQYARDHDLQPEPGFNPKAIRWAIVCDQAGRYLHILELGDTNDKKNKGKLFQRCPDMTQPELVGGSDTRSHFLVESLECIVLLDPANQEKSQAKHAYFANLLELASSSLPLLKAISAWLRDEEQLKHVVDDLRTASRKAKPSDRATFAIQGRTPAYLVEDPAWHDWWREFRTSFRTQKPPPKRSRGGETDVIRMRCLASSELVEPASSHPKITGLADVGGLATGDSMVSFDKDAFRSYGLEQSSNAALSEQMASAYTTGLNDLIRNHSRRLVTAKVVYWYSGNLTPRQDPIQVVDSAGLFPVVEDEVEERDMVREQHDAHKWARDLLDSVREGRSPDETSPYYYYAMTLSGAAGRVMVRDWMEGTFEELVENVTKWFEDLSIVRRDGSGLAPPPKFAAVLGATVRELKDLPAPFVASMWRSAIQGLPIPRQALAQALARARLGFIADEAANHARMGLLKAFHIRDPKKGEGYMKSFLNEEHPSVAYQCGRLMAVLADLQYDALGDVGANVVQRYYAAASTTPALVLGRLTRTSQFHLNKLEGGLPHWFEERIAGIWGRIKDGVPKTLTLEEQTLFALGYYQQKAARKAQSGTRNNSQAQTNSKE